MIELIFPDGNKREVQDGATGREIAASISKSLEKKAVLVKLDGELLTSTGRSPRAAASNS